jgi:hypothetical protein
MKITSILFLFVLIIPLSANAQITIDSTDIQSFFGVGTVNRTDTATSFGTVTIGTAGSTAQTFDLTGASFIPEYAIASVPVSQAPVSGIFTNLGAQFALVKQVSPNANYSYGAISGSSMLGYGAVNVASGVVLDTEIYNPPDLIFKLPMTYNTQWTSAYSYMSGSVVRNDTTAYIVDAFGTLKLPSATYQCVRLKSQRTRSKTTGYLYMTKEGVFAFVSVDTADARNSVVTPKSVGLDNYGPTAVNEPNVLVPQGLSLELFPSPLASDANTLTIEYAIPQPGNVELKLVNVYGETVAHIASGYESTGTHHAQALVTGIPAGAYLCVAHYNGKFASRMLTVVK